MWKINYRRGKESQGNQMLDCDSIPSPGEGNGNPLQYSLGGFHGEWSPPWNHKVGHNSATNTFTVFHLNQSPVGFRLHKGEIKSSRKPKRPSQLGAGLNGSLCCVSGKLGVADPLEVN